MSKLFSTLKIKDIVLRNRIAVSPMCQYSAINGFANEWHLVHYGSRAVGGAGLIIVEATAVSPEGRITPGDLGIYDDKHIEKLVEITSFIHDQGAIAGIQLAHAGRKASCAKPANGGKQMKFSEGGWKTIAPSVIPFNEDDEMPDELDKQGIQNIAASFKIAAARALQSGFKIIEIHAAHGYLIHEFLSPLSNHRTDNYGGNFENRIRFLVEIINAVQTVWPENLPLFVRISATDWIEGGWNLDEATKLATILKEMGVDLIDCSSGGMVPYAQIPFSPGYQVQFSDRIRKETGILTGTVGLITKASQAETILADNKADLLLLGREFLREPYFPLKAASELNTEINWPEQYLRAR